MTERILGGGVEPVDRFGPARAAELQGDAERAIGLYEAALAGEADADTEALNSLGALYYATQQFDAAARLFRQAVQLRPRFPRALCNLGACHNEQGRHGTAIACYERALDADPGFADAWRNLGKARGDLGDHELAVAAFHRAQALEPQPATGRSRARAYRRLGRYHRALALLQRAVQNAPDDVAIHFDLALTHLCVENYAAGFKEYEWRLERAEMIEHRTELQSIVLRPCYTGEALPAGTLLLRTEQGFGDNRMFARFVALLRPRVGRLAMRCRPGLGRLFAHSLPLDDVSEDLDRLPAFDVQLPLLSIPLLCDPELQSLDRAAPYLAAAPGTEPVLDTDPAQFNIGLVWGASDSGFDHRNKKVPLAALEPLFATPGTRWFALQVGSDRRDLASVDFHSGITDCGGQLTDFTATARAIAQLDLTISCDTATAHLAGAMGKPVWVLLKKDPDWRWGPDGERSRWYPSARLYRQDSFGHWDGLIRRLTRDLGHAASRHRER